VNEAISLYNRVDNRSKGKIKKSTLYNVFKEKYDLLYDIEDDVKRDNMIAQFETSFSEDKTEMEKIKKDVKKEKGVK